MSDIAYSYHGERNPGTEDNPAVIPGVPLRSLTKDEVEALPDYVKASIDASPMYQRMKTSAKASPNADKKEG